MEALRSGTRPVGYPTCAQRLLLIVALLGASVVFAQAAAPKRVVAIVPLGSVKQVYLDRVAQEIQARLGHTSMATTGRYLAALKRAENTHADELARRFGIDE